MDNYNVIDQIGKGAFSNVFLCKEKSTNLSIFLSGILNDDDDSLFIIKEIDIDSLVKKHMKKSRSEIFKAYKNKQISTSICDLVITPYDKDNKYKYIAKKLDTEETYYYKRLCDLIDSEIEILKKLNNNNIIKYFSHNLDITNGRIYCIKMEYCEYGDLYSILKNNDDKNFKLRNTLNGFEDSFIKKFLKDTISGLKYLHELNIIHRDIKLQNVLVSKTSYGVLFKLSDFGFSCFDIECELNDSLNISEFEFSTSSLQKKYYKLCGTPYYMAPEILLNIEEFNQLSTPLVNNTDKTFVKFYDKKIDLWSYGICLFELVFNKLPFININDIHDLKSFFSTSTTQNHIYDMINEKTIIDANMKNLLCKLLTINPSFRITANDLFIFTIEHDVKISNQDVIFINKKTPREAILNKNVIYEPLDLEPKKSIDMSTWNITTNSSEKSYLNSWDQINKTSSLITKMSIDNNFMKWLLKK